MRKRLLVLIIVSGIVTGLTVGYLVIPTIDTEKREFSEVYIYRGVYVLENYIGVYDIVKNKVGFYREYEVLKDLVSKTNSTNLKIVLYNGTQNGPCYLTSAGYYTLQPGTLYLSNSIIFTSSDILFEGGRLTTGGTVNPVFSLDSSFTNITFKNITIFDSDGGIRVK